MSYRRIVLLTVGVLVLGAVCFAAYQIWQLQRELQRAESSVSEIRDALAVDDRSALDLAISDLQAAAGEASERADGAWWSAMSALPFLGDDVQGLRVVSSTLSLVASDGVGPLADTLEQADGLVENGRIDLELMEELSDPIARAAQVFRAADSEVNALDPANYLGALRPRFVEYADQLAATAQSLASAETAANVAPAMLGADGPRTYLLLFQNNAEIRATGGMPGSWALIEADGGRLEMTEQGGAGDFPTQERPVLPLTDAERAVYGDAYGQYFQNPGFAPDFPRGAQLWRAHWDLRSPDLPLDGVLALDPVALSYLMEGLEPIAVAGRTLTSTNAVDELLSRPYLELDVEAQDAFFAEAARAVFDSAISGPSSPVAFIEGFSRAAREGRFLVAPFDGIVASELDASRVLGELSGDDGSVPHVDIGVNDATGSKMSYYLRYAVSVMAESCSGSTQELLGEMTLSQTISPAEAESLPVSVTGGGIYGTEPGLQTVPIRIYGPYGGSISNVVLDGERVDLVGPATVIDGRPVATVIVQLSSRSDVVMTWEMATGEGQTAQGEVGATPGVVPGTRSSTFASAC